MARISVDEIQSRIASIVDQDEVTTNVSSTDYSLRLKYMNMALLEWSEIADWQCLYNEYNTQTSTSSGNLSIALPSDFRKLASFPAITYDGSNTATFADSRPQERGQYNSTDKRVEMWGNPQDVYTMVVKGTNLVSGASIKVPYYMSVQSLASPANIPEIPNPEYLVRRTIAHIWEAADDPKFPQARAEAERILQNLLDQEFTPNEASTSDRVKTYEETRFSDFRIGRDGT